MRALAVDDKVGDGEAQTDRLALAGGEQAALAERLQEADGPCQIVARPGHVDLHELARRVRLARVDELGAHGHVAAVEPCRDASEFDFPIAEAVAERIPHRRAEGIKIPVAGKLVDGGAGLVKGLRILRPREGKVAGRHDLRRQHVGQRAARLLPGKAEEDDRAAGERGLIQLDVPRRGQHEDGPVKYGRDAHEHGGLLARQAGVVLLRRAADDDDGCRAVVPQGAEVHVGQRQLAAVRVLHGPGAVFAGEQPVRPDGVAGHKPVEHADRAPGRHRPVVCGREQLADAENGDGQGRAILRGQQRERPGGIFEQHDTGRRGRAGGERMIAHSECDIHV